MFHLLNGFGNRDLLGSAGLCTGAAISQILGYPAQALLLQGLQNVLPAVLFLLDGVLGEEDKKGNGLGELLFEVQGDYLFGEVLLDDPVGDAQLGEDDAVVFGVALLLKIHGAIICINNVKTKLYIKGGPQIAHTHLHHLHQIPQTHLHPLRPAPAVQLRLRLQVRLPAAGGRQAHRV